MWLKSVERSALQEAAGEELGDGDIAAGRLSTLLEARPSELAAMTPQRSLAVSA